jgi:hypothetical protein
MGAGPTGKPFGPCLLPMRLHEQSVFFPASLETICVE